MTILILSLKSSREKIIDKGADGRPEGKKDEDEWGMGTIGEREE